jgi:hypothetical protein
MNKLVSKHGQSHHILISLDKLEIWAASQDYVTPRPLATRSAPHWDDSRPGSPVRRKTQRTAGSSPLCKSHGNESPWQYKYLTPLPPSYLDLDFLPSPSLVFYLIKHSFRFFLFKTLHYILVYFCRRTTLYLSLSTFQGLLPPIPQICNSPSSLFCPLWLLLLQAQSPCPPVSTVRT